MIPKINAELSVHSAIGEIKVRIPGPGESFPLVNVGAEVFQGGA